MYTYMLKNSSTLNGNKIDAQNVTEYFKFCIQYYGAYKGQGYFEADTKKSILKYNDNFQDPKYSSIKNANRINSKLHKHKKNVYIKENKKQNPNNTNSTNAVNINKNLWANSLREGYSPKPFDFSMVNKTERNYELKAKKKVKDEYDWSKEIRLSGRRLTAKVVPNYDLSNQCISGLNDDNKHNNNQFSTCNKKEIKKQKSTQNNTCLYNDYFYAASTQPPPKIMASKNNHTILEEIEKELLALPKSIKFTPMY
ncbi:uncharacterized protein LOC111533412 [Piliocolobus tephrosceles]|uniref:uncharacterized protein LOC111533412 n=1 Tax=Piliocolobus tephrosceles TaxID=591936 RepID=UPI000E6B3D01|nr:uncharacterized protein LOC111533412 [Piliocolobus tephrosceles]